MLPLIKYKICCIIKKDTEHRVFVIFPFILLSSHGDKQIAQSSCTHFLWLIFSAIDTGVATEICRFFVNAGVWYMMTSGTSFSNSSCGRGISALSAFLGVSILLCCNYSLPFLILSKNMMSNMCIIWWLNSCDAIIFFYRWQFLTYSFSRPMMM